MANYIFKKLPNKFRFITSDLAIAARAIFTNFFYTIVIVVVTVT